MDLETLLDRMAETGATNLHLAYTIPPVFRINGSLENEGDTHLTPEELVRLLAPYLLPGQEETALQGGTIPVRVTRGDLVVDGEIFGYVGTLAAAFHKV